MARYDYYCDANGQTVEVVHSIYALVSSWGDLCQLASIGLGETDEEAPVRNIIEKRYDGTYENVTRTGTEKRFLDPRDPSSMPHLHKKISD